MITVIVFNFCYVLILNYLGTLHRTELRNATSAKLLGLSMWQLGSATWQSTDSADEWCRWQWQTITSFTFY